MLQLEQFNIMIRASFFTLMIFMHINDMLYILCVCVFICLSSVCF